MRINLNNDWKFMHGDFPDARENTFDDSDWYDVGIPHSFGIPYFMENHFYVGYGCYRKVLRIEPEWAGKRISLEFQGAFQDAEIFLNGQFAGGHKGGYTAFPVDVTDFVQPGENLLFVRLNNLWNPRLAPRGGEHVFNGGLYRDVSLLVKEPVHIAWYGTFIRTPNVSEEEAEIAISTEVSNESDFSISVLLVSTISFNGQFLFDMKTPHRMAPWETVTIYQNGTLSAPRLWSPESPSLYLLGSRVHVLDTASAGSSDIQQTQFGIRWFSFSATAGFFLNGKPYDILGANVHQDHAGWSDAVTHAGIRRDVKLVKDCGMNFIRGSHYPHHTVFADECDRQGLLFWSELCFWGTGGPKKEGYWYSSAYPVHEEDMAPFEESCLQALSEMIRTNRNHPGIIVWSMSNEPFFSCDEVMEKARALVGRLVSASREMDPTRPAAVGGAQRGGFDILGDLAGYNGDGAVLYPDPGIPNFVSEYGSTVADRPGAYEPGYTDGVEKHYPWRSGKALWCGFHHGSIFDDMGHMGMVDYHRLPLRTWYWYRNELLGIVPPESALPGTPHALRLEADKKVVANDGTDDVHIIVTLLDSEGRHISNAIPVTLRIVSGGGMLPTGETITLSPETGSFLDGQGAIEMRVRHAGEIHISAAAEGVVGDEMRILSLGGEKWDGRKHNFQLPPPSVLIPSQEGLYDIGRSRPVFCSSHASGCPAGHVTDGNSGTCWRPAAGTPGEWIMVDLEGRRSLVSLEVEFMEDWVNPLLVLGSLDGKQFTRLLERGTEKASMKLAYRFDDQKYRYLKILFPGKSSGIRSILLWAD